MTHPVARRSILLYDLAFAGRNDGGRERVGKKEKRKKEKGKKEKGTSEKNKWTLKRCLRDRCEFGVLISPPRLTENELKVSVRAVQY